jgi:hypothetical protein
LWDELLATTKQNNATHGERVVRVVMTPAVMAKAFACFSHAREKNLNAVRYSRICREEKAMIGHKSRGRGLPLGKGSIRRIQDFASGAFTGLR